MDEALFARRALGVQGKAAPRKATEAHQRKQQTQQKQEADKYEPTPDEMLEMMKLMRDAGLADGPPDVPDKLEVRIKQQERTCCHPGDDSPLSTALSNHHQSTHTLDRT
jgi:hypothetical protein